MSAGTAVAEPAWATDVNRFCERLAERLTSEGLDHPRSAAVALTVRGARSRTAAEYAIELGVPLELLRHIEQGHVPVADLPAALVTDAHAVDGLDWDRVVGG